MSKNKKKMKKVDVIKILKLNKDDADRIAGGMMRLESEYRSWSKYIKYCLNLADTPEEKELVWYFIGFKSGAMAAQGMLSIVDVAGPPKDKEDKMFG